MNSNRPGEHQQYGGFESASRDFDVVSFVREKGGLPGDDPRTGIDTIAKQAVGYLAGVDPVVLQLDCRDVQQTMPRRFRG